MTSALLKNEGAPDRDPSNWMRAFLQNLANTPTANNAFILRQVVQGASKNQGIAFSAGCLDEEYDNGSCERIPNRNQFGELIAQMPVLNMNVAFFLDADDDDRLILHAIEVDENGNLIVPKVIRPNFGANSSQSSGDDNPPGEMLNFEKMEPLERVMAGIVDMDELSLKGLLNSLDPSNTDENTLHQTLSDWCSENGVELHDRSVLPDPPSSEGKRVPARTQRVTTYDSIPEDFGKFIGDVSTEGKATYRLYLEKNTEIGRFVLTVFKKIQMIDGSVKYKKTT